MLFQLKEMYTLLKALVKNGICTLDRKMTSFRQSENIIAL